MISLFFLFEIHLFWPTESGHEWFADDYFDADSNETLGGSLNSANMTEYDESHLSADASERAPAVRVMCLVLTARANVETKAVHVNATWARRCNRVVFITSSNVSGYEGFSGKYSNVIELPIVDSRAHLWKKTQGLFRYAYRFRNEYDWFVKADDDTYVVVENLRHLLAHHSPANAHYFGRRFAKYIPQGYMSGGAGYVLSRKAVARFVEEGLADGVCKQGRTNAEDIEMGRCLHKLKIPAGDTRDQFGLERFFPLSPEYQVGGRAAKVTKKSDNWLQPYSFYPYKEGPGCCSLTPISFHYVTPKMMYFLDYLLYEAKIFRPVTSSPAPQPVTSSSAAPATSAADIATKSPPPSPTPSSVALPNASLKSLPAPTTTRVTSQS